MGKIIKGILGGVSGLVGTVVGASWRGIDTLRSRPKKTNIPPTMAQLSQRGVFTVASEFAQGIYDVLVFGFKNYKVGQTPYNAAFSGILENAVTGVYPLQTIDYTKVKIAKGSLTGVSGGAAASATVAEVDFSWSVNAQLDSPRLTDKITVLAFCPVLWEFVWVSNVVARSTGIYTLSVPATFSGEQVQCWMFFASADKKRVSDSFFAGAIAVL